jgi:ATP-dependent protease Clp ATPase subunit
MGQNPEVQCSFCGATVPANSGRAVAGPNVFICWDCIGLCMEITNSENPKWFDEKVAAVKLQGDKTKDQRS